MEIIFGTTSKRKIADLQNIINELELDLTILSMNDIGWDRGEIDETGSTIQENSYIKAKAIWDFCQEKGIKILILADDAGLFVDCLNGNPGVKTSRYAEKEREKDPTLPEYECVNKLLRQMEGVKNRTAQYRSAVTLMMPDGSYYTEDGISNGYVADKVLGPLTKPYFYAVFILDSYQKAFNELTKEELHDTYRYSSMRRILKKLNKKGRE